MIEVEGVRSRQTEVSAGIAGGNGRGRPLYGGGVIDGRGRPSYGAGGVTDVDVRPTGQGD